MQIKSFAATAAVVCLSFFSTIETTPAASVTTFVSATGSDANGCSSVSTACATLQRAHDNTTTNGNVIVLTPGSYGPVTITKTINITSDAPEAVIRTGTSTCGTGGFGAAVCIDAGSSDSVILSGLTIDLAGAAKHGIRANKVGSLHLNKSTIRRNASLTAGIAFLPGNSDSKLFVNDVMIADSSIGVVAQPAANAFITVTLNRMRLQNLALDGVELGFASNGSGRINAILRDSSISKAQRNATAASNGSGATQRVILMVDRTSMSENATAVNAEGNGVQYFIGDSSITGNTNAFVVSSGAVLSSLTSNLVDGNESDVVVPRPKRKLKEGKVSR